MIKIKIPEKVNRILYNLYNCGYEGYIVGGCVRDSILGREPNDWDICTNCTPDRMLEMFKSFKLVPTGLKHGTVTIVIDNEPFEVTTFRIDKEYNDGRHPNKVEFTSKLKEDLKRRDFTINAMAYRDSVGLIDFYGGMQDIEEKRIRCVGDPSQRFNEDHLRMLRAVRFSAQLRYNLDASVFQAIKELSNNIVGISKERIREEINKILLTEEPSRGFRLLYETGLLKFIIPEMIKCVKFEQRNPHHDKDVFDHIMSVLDNTKKDLILRLAALFHDIAKPQCFSIDEDDIGHFYNHHILGIEITEDILKRLKYDNSTIESVKILVKEHMSRYNKVNPRMIKRLINRVGIDNIERLFELQIADIKGSKESYAIKGIEEVKELTAVIINEKQPISVKDLAINGRDLIKLGIPQGKEVGVVLDKLLEKVLSNTEMNRKNLLIIEAKNIILKMKEGD